uniref:Glutathione S-transferase kappa n=2 Tax=Steinernema glaseri TaxID=37863 RepID=A0A1I7Z5M2_9BILA
MPEQDGNVIELYYDCISPYSWIAFESGAMPEQDGNVIELYYDCISPYSWIAFEVLTSYEKILPFKLKLKPYSLPWVMKGASQIPPALQSPAKAMYMMKDLKNVADYWNVPLHQPEDFLGGTLKRGTAKAQRFLTAIQLNQPKYLEAASRELFKRVWSTDKPVHQIEHLREVAASIGLPDADKIIGAVDSPRVKETLKKRTDEALEQGAFGAPWIVLRRPNKEEKKCAFSEATAFT